MSELLRDQFSSSPVSYSASVKGTLLFSFRKGFGGPALYYKIYLATTACRLSQETVISCIHLLYSLYQVFAG